MDAHLHGTLTFAFNLVISYNIRTKAKHVFCVHEPSLENIHSLFVHMQQDKYRLDALSWRIYLSTCFHIAHLRENILSSVIYILYVSIIYNTLNKILIL